MFRGEVKVVPFAFRYRSATQLFFGDKEIFIHLWEFGMVASSLARVRTVLLKGGRAARTRAIARPNWTRCLVTQLCSEKAPHFSPQSPHCRKKACVPLAHFVQTSRRHQHDEAGPSGDDVPPYRRDQPSTNDPTAVLTVPNVITVSRMVSSPYISYLIINEQWESAMAGLCIAGLSDALDGYCHSGHINVP